MGGPHQTVTRSDRVALSPLAGESLAALLLTLRVRGRPDRFVRFQAGTECAAKCRSGRDEPGQHEKVAVTQVFGQFAAHHGGVEDEQRPAQVDDVQREIANEHPIVRVTSVDVLYRRDLSRASAESWSG